jgi:tellurite methyltransferase
MNQVSAGEREPARFLVENLELLPRGKALDLAMGGGRNAVYLAGQGFEVEGVDISEEAFHQAMDLAGHRGVKIKARVADLERNYRIQSAAYDVILVFNYLQRDLFPHIINGLKAGGMAVYETFTIDQPQLGHPKNPDYLLRYNELLEHFRPLRVLRYQEGIFDNSAARAAIIAQKI